MAVSNRSTAKREKVIFALLTKPTIQEAAQAAGVGERTVYTWLKERTFADAYHEARAAAVSQAIARLQQASSEAVDTLKGVMTSPDSPAPAKVATAKTVLDMALRGTETMELLRRVKELEQAQSSPDETTEEDPIVSAD